jgi:RecJ-like exonuclease
MILSTEIHTAQKVHKCDWCGSDIAVGQKYLVSNLIENREFYRWKSHSECDDFAQEHLFDGFGDNADSFDFCCEVRDVARDKGFDSDLDEYELVKLIMEVESAC